jgi:coproporphyrinogen III oxidase
MAGLQGRITDLITTLDGHGQFAEQRWMRNGGGGGVARMLADGQTFERAGVNRSAVDGVLPPAAAARLGITLPGAGATFFATGVSVVIHPRSPIVPTVHLNVRYLELRTATGEPADAWFGGGSDLTPTYPQPEDARHFHRALRHICAAHAPALYHRFKQNCDDYFRSPHRGGEARGIGGIFFDHLRAGENPAALGPDALFAFVMDVGTSLEQTYAPIVEKRRAIPYGARERTLQLLRRGRYVEFNLLHDRGTLFGLHTNARTASVLMSMPPMASWDQDPAEMPGTLERELHAMLAPRDWIAD